MAVNPVSRPRVLSGIQPTSGSFHLGNYVGAVKQWVALQEDNDSFYCVVDLHALTLELPDPSELRERTLVSAAQLLAAGLDVERCSLFLQSHVAAHTRLSWVMECLTGFGEASRMTQFKDKAARTSTERVGVGLFTYPILQVADILAYDANYVPVGADQRQHVELTRTLAQRFNARYGETFVVPDAYILPESAKIFDLQNPSAKMSKSLPDAGTVNLLDDPAAIEKKIKRAVTDTETEIRFDPEAKPGVSNLLSSYAAFSGRSIAEAVTEFSGQGYGRLKAAVADVVVSFAQPFAKRVDELMDDRAELERILARGAQRANEIADETVRRAYDAVGFVPAAASL